ncbi:MAG: hypothetical protein MZV49_22335 [Rhodopseudomonas palustris]|nr:hypothetical protein [Rhodopseudomonas palustris]
MTERARRPLGLQVTPSVGNFLLMHFPQHATARPRAGADTFLHERRHHACARVDAYGLPDALRMTIGTEEANRVGGRRRSGRSWQRPSTDRLTPLDRLALDRRSA